MQEISLEDLSGFQATGANWQIVGGVSSRPGGSHDAFETTPGTGVLVNQPGEGQRSNIVTVMEHGDLDLSVEFMMTPHSNSGIYLMGRYEIQLYDSWGKARPSFADCGGVYERWDDSKPDGEKGYQGYAPRMNAARAPGLWQRLDISFQAPRFDEAGRKIQNARLLEVRLNGALIHQNIELVGPTRGPMIAEEGTKGPLLIQGDHGPVAFRNIRYQSYSAEQASVSDLSYEVYLKEFVGVPALSDGDKPARTGTTDIFTQNVAGESEDFMLVLKGKLTVPREDTYQLVMNALGYGKLFVDGKEVFGMNMWRQRGEMSLAAGAHDFEIHYAKDASWYNNGLSLFIAGTQMRSHPLHVLSSMPVDEPSNPIYANVESPRPRILRSFMDYPTGEATRRIVHAVNVGLPHGISYTFDPDQAAFVQVWKGGFLNTTPMWLDRGDGSSRPAGPVLGLGDRVGMAALVSQQADWPAQLPASYDFKGYEMDEMGHPIFRYALADAEIRDRLMSEDQGKVTREVTLPEGLGQTLYFRLGEGTAIADMGDGLYHVDQAYFVQVTGSGKALVRDLEGGKQLLLAGKGGQVLEYEVIW